MPRYTHFGLYFTPTHVQKAQKARSNEPLQSAWSALETLQPPDPLGQTMTDGLRWRFLADTAAGERAAALVANGVGLNRSKGVLEALLETAGLAQAAELLHDHPAFTAYQARWLAQFGQHMDALNETMEGADFVETIWLGLVNLLAGIVLEDDARFEAGAAVYRQVILNDVRPEGFLPRAVEGGDGGSLLRQLLASGALTLMAEAASHVGVDLWSIESRGISAVTAASYTLYYYYYPDQWRWDVMTEAQAKPLFQTWSSFIEITHQHAGLRDVKLMLNELRPYFNPVMGGLTTLSHGAPARRGLFG